MSGIYMRMFYSNFKYTRLEGFSRQPNVSRRDPSKVLRIEGRYYVWYSCRRTEAAPSGYQNAADAIPSVDWDLAEVGMQLVATGFIG